MYNTCEYVHMYVCLPKVRSYAFLLLHPRSILTLLTPPHSILTPPSLSLLHPHSTHHSILTPSSLHPSLHPHSTLTLLTPPSLSSLYPHSTPHSTLTPPSLSSLHPHSPHSTLTPPSPHPHSLSLSSLHSHRQFLIPGFIDAHIHAPQYLYTGTGYDLELIEWLQRYTFPSESKYGNPAFCDQVYRKVVVSVV